MGTSEQIAKRFEELLRQGEKVLSTRYTSSSEWGGDYVDDALSREWATSCLGFLEEVVTKESVYHLRFAENAKQINNPSYAARACADLRAAKENYGLSGIQKLIRAEVFAEFLEQANYFLKEGYFEVAAVIAGTVLEDGLRKLCIAQHITLSDRPKLDWMNARLAKSGLYGTMVQKKVTWLADIRNKAAHGEWKAFSQKDASEMINGVRRLMTDFLSGQRIPTPPGTAAPAAPPATDSPS